MNSQCEASCVLQNDRVGRIVIEREEAEDDEHDMPR